MGTSHKTSVTGADTGGGVLGAQVPPLSQDNIQVSIDIWLSKQL